MAQAMTGGVSYRTGHTPSVSAYAEPPPSEREARPHLLLRIEFERAGHAAAPTVPQREIFGKSIDYTPSVVA